MFVHDCDLQFVEFVGFGGHCTNWGENVGSDEDGRGRCCEEFVERSIKCRGWFSQGRALAVQDRRNLVIYVVDEEAQLSLTQALC